MVIHIIIHHTTTLLIIIIGIMTGGGLHTTHLTIIHTTHTILITQHILYIQLIQANHILAEVSLLLQNHVLTDKAVCMSLATPKGLHLPD